MYFLMIMINMKTYYISDDNNHECILAGKPVRVNCANQESDAEQDEMTPKTGVEDT